MLRAGFWIEACALIAPLPYQLVSERTLIATIRERPEGWVIVRTIKQNNPEVTILYW